MKEEKAKEWVRLYSDSLFRFAYKRVNDYDTAKDLVQETFISAINSLESYKGETSEKNWLYLILKRKTIDYYRKTNSRNKYELKDNWEDSFFDENGMWKSDAMPEPWSDDISENLEKQEMLGIIEECVNNLKGNQKLTFIMKYYDDIDSSDICKELGITNDNFWVLIHRARLSVRRCADKYLRM